MLETMVCAKPQAIFEEASELVEACPEFKCAKKGLLFKKGPAGTGYYKDDLKARMAEASAKAAETKKSREAKSASNEMLKRAAGKAEEAAPAMIDLATLNSAIGSYGGTASMGLGSSMFGSSGTGMKSLFSL